MPRLLFGRYLVHLVDEAVSAGKITVKRGYVIDVRRRAERAPSFKVLLEDGRSLRADKVVLATGNLPPACPEIAAPDGRQLADMPQHVGDPWSAHALKDLDSGGPVLLIGTGLTMTDTVLSLIERGHSGPIFALSRHGLLPLPHNG